MNIGQLSTHWVRNRHLLVLSLALTLVAGAAAFFGLPRLEDPRIVHRNPLIITLVPGASAERVEALVTEPLEEELQEIAEIMDLESTSRAGISLLTIELEAAVGEADQPMVFSRIRDRLSDAALRLPPEALPPLFEDQREPVAYTRILGVSWTGDEEPIPGILSRLAEELADRVRRLPATEMVEVYGAAEEEITVTVDSDELASLGWSPDELSRRLAQADAKVSAGVLRAPGSDILVEVEGELDSVERIARVPLRSDAAGGVLRLGDIAEVRKQPRAPVRELASVDGARSVLVAARMDPSAQIGSWAAAADAVEEEFRREVAGGGLAVTTVFEQGRYTQERLAQLLGNLLAGAVVVVLVVFFTMGLRLALIVGSALPLTFALTLFGLQITGQALHQMAIFGMIIALGLLIDNAIVVADEVAKLRRRGVEAVQAVLQTVNHLALPLGASTLTTVLAFAPILLLPGSAGDFVGSIGGSVILALVFSLALALTVIVSLASLFSGGRTPKTRLGRFLAHGVESATLARWFRGGLGLAVRSPVAAIALACFLPFAGFALSRTLGSEFFPQTARDMFELRLTLASDSSIESTIERTRAVEEFIRRSPDVERVHWMVGRSFPPVYYNLVENRDGSANYAQAIVQTTSSEATTRAVAELQRELDDAFPDTEFVLRAFGQGPPITADVEIRLYGPSVRVLQDLGERVALAMQQHPDVLHAAPTIRRGEPKLWVGADEDEVLLSGLTLGSVAAQLRSNLEGSVGGSVREDLEELPVRVRFRDAERRATGSLEATNLAAADGFVPLRALGEIELRPETGAITRYNGERSNTVEGYVQSGALPIDVTRQVMAELEASPEFVLPAGYRIALGGAIEQDERAQGNLALYVPILLAAATATLILAFRSVRIALMLGAIAGMSVGLGLLSTWTVQFPVGFNTILGTLGLIGVALNDSIVVLAAIRARPEARAGDLDAIVEEIMGCSRHVISTTLTTVGGFLPLLLFSEGTFWPSLAIVLVGGIVGAMILALLFIPAVYVLVFGRRRAREDANEPMPALGGVS